MSTNDLLKKYADIVDLAEDFDENHKTFANVNEDEFDANTAIEQYFNQNSMHSFEGDTRNLSKLIDDVCGYDGLEYFLGDNPGAQEAMVAWITEFISYTPEWQENLKDHVVTDEPEAGQAETPFTG